MAKIKIDSNLYQRIKRFSETAGYSSPEEFVIYLIEKELAALESADDEQQVIERLRGLGYLE